MREDDFAVGVPELAVGVLSCTARTLEGGDAGSCMYVLRESEGLLVGLISTRTSFSTSMRVHGGRPDFDKIGTS